MNIFVPFGEIFEIAPRELAGRQDLPVMSITMRDGLIDQNKKFKKRIASNDISPYKVVRKGNLVVGFPINEGVLGFQHSYDRAAVSPAYDIWQVTGIHPVDIKYFERILRAPMARAIYAAKMRGTTSRRRTIPKDIFRQITFHLPPLSEQKHIAVILDAADALRQKDKALIAKYDELLKSTLYSALGPSINIDIRKVNVGSDDYLPPGYKWERLIDVTSEIADIDHNMPKSVENGMLFLSAKDLHDNGELDFSNAKMISTNDFNRLSRKIKPQMGDIIYSRIGAKLGKARLVKSEAKFLVSYSCCTIRPIDELISKIYLRYYLDSEQTLRQASQGTKSIGVPDLGMSEIREFLIPIPPMSTMKIIEEEFQIIEKQKAIAQESLNKSEALFNSLLQKAFKGELTN
ncbi:MAG: hypothetical protein HOB84_04270 [Candidatus Marinimicrobia bacterium]|jgi:type I restriction enzyme, S subunit|nr:hypothetical protein [Candidatus Neomarinimicrobiota bacterium]MBT4947260.1 hypothetical protein [Candidatus Neomarinimicrobiota bacterium]MBT5269951.1 hypothetical protein [Candidatus Neomarinimicrobiota bacterium]MBT6010987.1 hypothetical protein [Candidatus Neomarinimicrobiota bacterium]